MEKAKIKEIFVRKIDGGYQTGFVFESGHTAISNPDYPQSPFEAISFATDMIKEWEKENEEESQRVISKNGNVLL